MRSTQYYMAARPEKQFMYLSFFIPLAHKSLYSMKETIGQER
jgi:hypothetical protein